MNPQFQVEILYVKRSRRVTLRLLPNRIVKVTAPKSVSKSEIAEIVLQKTPWILKKYQVLDSLPVPRQVQFQANEVLPFYGEDLTLKFISGFAGGVVRNENFLYCSGFNVRKSVIGWYREQALEKILPRVAHFTSLLGVKARDVSVRSYKARWGACSSKGDLILNWQIVTFSPELMDYIIAHEVCHLKEMNHGPEFYRHLESLGFDRKVYDAQLKAKHNIL